MVALLFYLLVAGCSDDIMNTMSAEWFLLYQSWGEMVAHLMVLAPMVGYGGGGRLLIISVHCTLYEYVLYRAR